MSLFIRFYKGEKNIVFKMNSLPRCWLNSLSSLSRCWLNSLSSLSRGGLNSLSSVLVAWRVELSELHVSRLLVSRLVELPEPLDSLQVELLDLLARMLDIVTSAI